MLGVKCSRFSASGQQYCDETAGGLDPVNTANSAPWRSASSIGSSRSSSSRSSGGSWVMSAPALTPHLDYDDELFYEGNKVRSVRHLFFTCISTQQTEWSPVTIQSANSYIRTK